MPAASFTATISSCTLSRLPARKAPRSMTMSTSSAPASTASWVSASLMSRAARPDGNAVATAATCRWSPTTSRTVATMSGYTQTAAAEGQLGSVGSGLRALADRARTLPGVSAPSSVVRSTIEMARSIAHCLDGGLDRAGAERSGPGLEADGVDAGQSFERPAQ